MSSRVNRQGNDDVPPPPRQRPSASHRKRVSDRRAAEAAEAEAANIDDVENDPEVNPEDEESDDPQDMTLLTTYRGHKASEIWKGNDPGPMNRFLNRIFGMTPLSGLPEQVRALVLGSGLAPLRG